MRCSISLSSNRLDSFTASRSERSLCSLTPKDKRLQPVRTSTQSCFSETRTSEVESHHSRLSPNARESVSHATVTWDVTESSDDPVVLVVDDAGSPALDATAVPHLTLPSPHALGGINLEKNGTCERSN